jgi:hypothetical protein
MKTLVLFLFFSTNFLFTSCVKTELDGVCCGSSNTTGTGSNGGVFRVTSKPSIWNLADYQNSYNGPSQTEPAGPAMYTSGGTAYPHGNGSGLDITTRIISYINVYGEYPDVTVENGWVTGVND